MIALKRPNVLYLVHRVPFPADRGDRIRSLHTLRFLSSRANVYLGCLADEPLPRGAMEHLQQLAKRVAVIPLGRRMRWARAAGSLLSGRTATEGLFASPQLRQVVSRWAREVQFDAALLYCSSMVQYAQAPELKNVPAVIDLVDVDSQKWFEYASNSSGLRRRLYRLEGRRLRRLESSLPALARAVVLVSEAEADLYHSFAPSDRVHAVPNGVDLDYFHPNGAAVESMACVFVGVLNYRPNVEGLIWFCSEVWPEIRRQIPQATLTIVGRSPAAAVQALARTEGVRVVGQVEDVRPYLSRAAVAVVPLRIARGMQNKVLEALAMGKAVVATRQALEGLQLKSGVEAMSASTAGEWVVEVVRLLRQPELRAQLGHAGRAYVEQHHHWDHQLQAFEALLAAETNGHAS